MASVSSLDADLRNMRLSKYTTAAANEVREWIEEVLGERLSPDGGGGGGGGGGDLLDLLKDGVALCRLVNLAVPSPGVKYKKSNMPFVQMENISHFLRAVQAPPLGLPDHDVFLTVDLYEAKDPAQVLQCLGAFSRRANIIQPASFRRTLGPKAARGSGSATLSPQSSGTGDGWATTTMTGGRGRDVSTTSQSSSVSTSIPDSASVRSSDVPRTGGKGSTQTSPRSGGVSSWSRKTDEGNTAPAWNIYQYGYMGGASQGNQGVSFGARRQITSAGPTVVSSLAEKERRRREEDAERERLRLEKEEVERRGQMEREAEEERQRIAEEERWKEETRRRREKERLEAEEERKRWEEEERKWNEEEERRQRATGHNGLNGQYLSQYLSGQAGTSKASNNNEAKRSVSDSERVRELERQLELARQRERQYLAEREESKAWTRGHTLSEEDDTERMKKNGSSQVTVSGETPIQSSLPNPSKEELERLDLQNEWSKYNNTRNQSETPPPYIASSSPDVIVPKRPLPDPAASSPMKTIPPTGPSSSSSSRPLPDPSTYSTNKMNRTDRFLATNPAPRTEKAQTHIAHDFGFDSAAERHAEDVRRDESQNKTKAGGWASKSLLEREMERERQRQQEWEEAQRETHEAVVGKAAARDKNTMGGGDGGSWEGWTGGDGQNRAGLPPAAAAFGGRRQIIGPRPPP
ncbi:MAG: hypothetical protein M1816_002644 [Peltula sp. TS41687]|nr:MAG: hypothetical protein M1816_002644 [Peltula sp. TS41687]